MYFLQPLGRESLIFVCSFWLQKLCASSQLPSTVMAIPVILTHLEHKHFLGSDADAILFLLQLRNSEISILLLPVHMSRLLYGASCMLCLRL